MNPNDTREAREEMTKAGLDRDDIDRGSGLDPSESQLVTVILDS